MAHADAVSPARSRDQLGMLVAHMRKGYHTRHLMSRLALQRRHCRGGGQGAQRDAVYTEDTQKSSNSGGMSRHNTEPDVDATEAQLARCHYCRCYLRHTSLPPASVRAGRAAALACATKSA